ncbi:45464_t:CDS:1, partial [Gigaspora margarita]
TTDSGEGRSYVPIFSLNKNCEMRDLNNNRFSDKVILIQIHLDNNIKSQ